MAGAGSGEGVGGEDHDLSEIVEFYSQDGDGDDDDGDDDHHVRVLNSDA